MRSSSAVRRPEEIFRDARPVTASYPFLIDGSSGHAYTDFFKLLPMNRLAPLAAATLLAGCASLADQEKERPKDVIKDPAKIHGFFLKMIREDKPGIAAQVTSISEEALTIGVRNRIAPDLTRRILLGFEQHDLKVSDDRTTATARWCNREFGVSRDFTLRSEA